MKTFIIGIFFSFVLIFNVEQLQAQDDCKLLSDHLSAIDSNFKGKYDVNTKVVNGGIEVYSSNSKIFNSAGSNVFYSKDNEVWTMRLAFEKTKTKDKYDEIVEKIAKCIIVNNLKWNTYSEYEESFDFPVTAYRSDDKYLTITAQVKDGDYHIIILMWYEAGY